MAQPAKKKIVVTLDTDTYSTKVALDLANAAHDACADLKVGNTTVKVTGVAVK